MMNGRGSTPLIRVTARHTTANTTICPTSHQRRCTNAETTPITANRQLMAMTNHDWATSDIRPPTASGTLVTRFFQTSSSYDWPSSVNTHTRQMPNPAAISSRPNTAHSTRLEIRGRTANGSSLASPRSTSPESSGSRSSSPRDGPRAGEPSPASGSMTFGDALAAAEPDPNAANGSLALSAAERASEAPPTILAGACGSRITGFCASFIFTTVRPRPGQCAASPRAQGQIRTKEKPPRTRQRPLTLAAFLPWGSWVTYRHAEAVSSLRKWVDERREALFIRHCRVPAGAAPTAFSQYPCKSQNSAQL